MMNVDNPPTSTASNKLISIDLITLQGVQNYGSVLQALATQALFEDLGAEVTVINYVKEPNRYENLAKTWGQGNPLKSLVMLPTVRRWKTVFLKFNKDNLNLTDKLYSSDDDFVGYNSGADAYCTGSDQVWNSVWNRGVLRELYLHFAPEGAYRFAFSASFGQSRLSKKEVDQTKKLIQQYARISVREDSGLKILKEQYEYQGAVQTVDPTLCMSANFWRKYAAKRSIEDDYILVYNLNRSREFDDYAIALSKKTGLKLVRLCTRYDQFYRPGKSILVPTVYEFISLIDNASCVLTDSFHASAFSMNMGTEPICVYPHEFGGRLASFLRLTHSEQRHADGFDDLGIIDRHVEFSTVNQILDMEREKARAFLTETFADIRRRRS